MIDVCKNMIFITVHYCPDKDSIHTHGILDQEHVELLASCHFLFPPPLWSLGDNHMYPLHI